MVRVGIIGAGYWGTNLIRSFNDIEGAELAAVADTKPGRLSYVDKRYPHVKTTADYRELLSDPTIDAIVVSTPVTTHFDIGKEVLLAGKHAFIEKPLAYNFRDASELHELALQKNRRLAVGHIYQFSPAVEWMVTHLTTGQLGDVYHIDTSRINSGPPKSEVDVVWDLAPHDLSIILYFMRRAGLSTGVKSLRAMGHSYTREGLTDLVHIFIEFDSGLSAHIHVSWVTSNKVRLMQISAKKGTVVFDDMAPSEKVKVFSEAIDTRINADASKDEELTYRPGDIFIPTLPRREPLSRECSHFIDAIQTGTETENDGSIGVEVVRLLEMISEEVKRGRSNG
jgi:predicted dehydrogenase